jgi:ADP-heptose:LPS heptosyltransferase
VIALDLVITVCTAVVHLAGALGKPVWILTPLSPGWRYTATRTSMPWYPSSRIFRQKHYDEWLPVCREVSDELTHLTKIGRPIGQHSST